MGSCRAYILIATLQLAQVLAVEEVVKRSPHGFFGMRGKKYMEPRDTEMFKRRPNFFVGVKGKRAFEYPEDLWPYKRTPMGFVGMRGKKEFTDFPLPYSFEYDPKRNAISQMDYINDANRDSFMNAAINEYLQKLQSADDDDSRITNEVDKRAFYGVRGKKSMPEKRQNRPRGFIGVRGKKDVRYGGPKEIKFLLSGPWPKRKAQTGFMGMRGKKWTDADSSSEMDTSN
ncbi:tachykinins [Zerene cesonia]|uniref:tachykinins n=1 Tax=Zerene cesonia TaxID=33412 RepID=UPI0018E5583B|nr:tachykinins [Zerene cesonia]